MSSLVKHFKYGNLSMADSFINKSELDDRFFALGNFYKLQIDEVNYQCRSILDLLSIDYRLTSYNECLNLTPEALFIMMNPGKSEPINGEYNSPIKAEDFKLKITMTPAVPDPTQYQLMRIMFNKNIKHVRVLNLSDIKDGYSSSFETTILNVKTEIHSIFHKKRNNELSNLLKTKTKIYAAWGVGAYLDPLISLANNKIQIDNLIGLRKEGTADKFYHPLLQGKPFSQKEWIIKMLDLISRPNI